MTQLAPPSQDLEFRIELERRIQAPIEAVFDALVDQLGPEAVTPEGNSLSMKLEPFPGGRWYRNLGGDEGHLATRRIHDPNMTATRRQEGKP